MIRSNFIDDVKGKESGDITLEDCINYYKFFNSIEQPLREKLLGRQTLYNMGQAFKVYWEHAVFQHDVLGKDMVQTPNGMYLKSNRNPNSPIREKVAEEVPLNMPVADCKKKFQEYCGRIKSVT